MVLRYCSLVILVVSLDCFAGQPSFSSSTRSAFKPWQSSGKKEESAAYKRIQLLDPIEESHEAPQAKQASVETSSTITSEQSTDSGFPPLWELDRRLRGIVENNFQYKNPKYPYLQRRLVQDQSAKDEEQVVRPLLRKLICLTCSLISQRGEKGNTITPIGSLYKFIFEQIETDLRNEKSISKFNDEFLRQLYYKYCKSKIQVSPDALVIPEQLKEWCLTGIVPDHLENFKKLFDSSCQKWIKEHLEDQQAEQLYTAMFKLTDRYSTIPSFKKEFVGAIKANFDDPQLGGAIFLLPLEEYEFIAKELAR